MFMFSRERGGPSRLPCSGLARGFDPRKPTAERERRLFSWERSSIRKERRRPHPHDHGRIPPRHGRGQRHHRLRRRRDHHRRSGPARGRVVGAGEATAAPRTRLRLSISSAPKPAAQGTARSIAWRVMRKRLTSSSRFTPGTSWRQRAAATGRFVRSSASPRTRTAATFSSSSESSACKSNFRMSAQALGLAVASARPS